MSGHTHTGEGQRGETQELQDKHLEQMSESFSLILCGSVGCTVFMKVFNHTALTCELISPQEDQLCDFLLLFFVPYDICHLSVAADAEGLLVLGSGFFTQILL